MASIAATVEFEFKLKVIKFPTEMASIAATVKFEFKLKALKFLTKMASPLFVAVTQCCVLIINNKKVRIFSLLNVASV